MWGGVVLALVAALVVAAPARAADGSCGQLDPNPPAPSPRIVAGELEGHPYNVLLPADYARTDRRYPVLYLLPGRQYSEHSWLVKTDVAEFTKGFTARAAIVVTPSMGFDNWALDYYDGTQDWERYALDRLIPHIDAKFRTIPDGAHRAVAGFSAGGAGAVRWAAHRPELFAAAGAMSAPVPFFTAPDDPYAGPGDVSPPAGGGSPGPARGPADDPYAPPKEGCQEGGDAIGNPATNRWFLHGNDAAGLAVNLRGLGVYISNGTGQICSPQEYTRDPTFIAAAEAGLRTLNREFGAALTAAEVPHVLDELPCGAHNMVTAEAGLHAFWEVMVRSFGRPVPRRFDYRSLFPDATAWGWTFRADQRRAPEFVEVRGASAGGLTLIGSGTETVVTPPLFEPGETVRVGGAAPATATADSAGRITFAADLGEPASTPQFDGGERRFTARRITFAGTAATPSVATAAVVFPGDRPCARGGTLTLRLRHPGRKERRVSVAVSVNGKRVLVRRTRASAARKTVVLRDLPTTDELRIGVRVRTTRNRVLRALRAYPAC